MIKFTGEAETKKVRTRRPMSAETKAKISKSHTGKVRGPMSEEQKEKLSKASKGRPLSAAHRKVVGSKQGVEKSKAHRKAMSEAHLKRNKEKRDNETLAK